MKTQDLYLNTIFTSASILSAVIKAILFTAALLIVFSAILFVGFAIFTITSMIFTFIVSNFAGIVLAVVLIAVLKKIVLR